MALPAFAAERRAAVPCQSCSSTGATGQTDGEIDRRADTIPLDRRCSACYAVSAKKSYMKHKQVYKTFKVTNQVHHCNYERKSIKKQFAVSDSTNRSAFTTYFCSVLEIFFSGGFTLKYIKQSAFMNLSYKTVKQFQGKI